MRNHRSHGTAGFSLVEVLTVVAVIGIMAAMAGPNIMTWIRTSKIRAAAQEVASEIQTARARAITKNVNKGVAFVILSDNSYRFVVEDNLFQTAGWEAMTFADRAAVDGQAGTSRRLPEGVVFLAGNDSGLRYNRLGAACDPGSTSSCAALGTGWNGMTNSPSSTTVIASVTLSQSSTGLCRKVQVAPGGRVYVLEGASCS